MDNIIDVIITPYSALAVKELLAVEKKHKLFSKGDRRECDVCRVNLKGEYITDKDIIYHPLDYPCPILVTSRESASKETLIAVALTLSGERA